MTQNTNQDRAEFEAWCDSNEYDRVTRLDGSGYNNEKTKRAWAAWQAARQALVVPWLRVIDEAMVVTHLGVAAASDDYETAKKKLNSLISWEIDVSNYFNTAATQPPEAAKLDEIRAAWNAQADEFNQWGELGEDEKVEWAAAYAATKERAAISKATDDVSFDDFAEDVEDNECHNCSGTGEGMYDSQSCVVLSR